MLNEEDKGHKEDYRRNLTAKPYLGLEQLQEICKEPTRQEITLAIQRMRNSRAPGDDTVVVELIKCGEGVMDAVQELTKLIRTTESIPQEWNTGILCTLYEKGDKPECNNYKGITLLNNTCKIFSSILNERLKIVTEKITGEYQCGLRRNKSTIDQIFVLRQMIEKHNEHGLHLHTLFIDFKQAFDSINRERLFGAMDRMGIPQKLIRLVKITMCQTKAREKTDDKLSAPFEFNKGIKQGDGVSTAPSILAQHYVAKEMDQRGAIFTKSRQICAHADDVVIVTGSETGLRQVYRETEEKT